MKNFILNVIRRVYYFAISIKYNCTKHGVHLSLSSRVKNGTQFENAVKVGARSYLSGHIGGYTYIGADCELGRVKIGRFCSISPNVSVITGGHPVTFASTSPVFYSTACQCGASFAKEDSYQETNLTEDGYSCEIGNDVWIGEGVRIKGGVKIGDGAVIAMGAVVTKDVEPYTICGGVPARVIKSRFAPDVTEALLNSKWWDEDPAKLRACTLYVNDPMEFVKKIKEGK